MKYNGLINTRDSLVEFSNALAMALSDEYKRAQDKTFLVSLEGHYGCGKSLLADQVVKHISDLDLYKMRRRGLVQNIGHGLLNMFAQKSGDRAVFSGRSGFDEYVSVKIDSETPIEVSTIDMAYRSDQFSFWGDDGDGPDKTFGRYMHKRQHGGIAFVQNANARFKSAKIDNPIQSDIDLWVEGSLPYRTSDVRRNKDTVSDLKSIFGEEADIGGWGRYIEIEIHNPVIGENSHLMEFLKNRGFKPCVQQHATKRQGPAVIANP